MKAIIFIPYANGSCTKGFRYDKPLSAQQFVQMETKEYNDHKDGVDMMMTTRYGDNMAINMYDKRRFKYTQQNYAYHKCNCAIMDIEGGQMSLNELKRYAETKEQFILILNLNEKQIKEDPDLETDLRMWFDESNKVKNCNRLSDVEVMYHLPKKDFKLKIEEGNLNAVLKDCKFVKFMSSSFINAFAIIVNKIIFVKE